ncbi:hypothetical protein [Agromyces subbeticus]|nr:hypothetical protein [Agromyces subbeticus]
MNDTNPATATATGPTAASPGGHSTERVLWWVAFGVLTFAALAMLSLWN